MRVEFGKPIIFFNIIQHLRGDGDQAFFGNEQILREVKPEWFDSKYYCANVDAPVSARLFQVISERSIFKGRYVVLTSRWTISIKKQLDENKFASVIVHLTEPNFQYGYVNNSNSTAIGMSVLELY